MKNLKSILLTLAVLLCSTVANAYSFEADGIYYKITSGSALTVGVTYKTSDYNSYSGDVVIPSTVIYDDKTYTVTSIDYNAFSACSNLTSITLPEGVTSIGSYAFYYCSSLTTMNIPESVTSIDKDAFSGCSLEDIFYGGCLESWLKINYASEAGSRPHHHARNIYINGELPTEIEIPSTMTSIPSYAFSHFKYLTSITIPESVTSIGSYAFYGCSSLTSITIPDGVTDIGSAAFSGCKSLTSINVPEGVTSIGSYAFYNCNSLTSITIPESVTSIGSYAFYNCNSLTSITIPESVTSIGSCAFYGCTGLKELIIEDGSQTLSLGYTSYYNANGNYVYAGLFHSAPLETLYLGRNLVYNSNSGYGYSPFFNKETLTSVVLGEKVTSISDYLFSGCSSLTRITLPESVVSIGKSAFENCRNLISVILSEGVTSIGDAAFGICSSLISVNIPKTVSDIGASTFFGCNSLISIIIPEDVTSIGDYAFTGIKEVVIKSTTPPTLTSASLISDDAVIAVPAAAYNDYSTATYWADLTANITVDDVDARVKSLTLEADDGKSSLQVAVGDDKLKYVTDLTISGTINSYDFMIIRNKMPVLRHLNLKDATIVYNAYEHYTGYHTEDNKFPGYGLYNCNILTLVFPETITSVGYNAVASNDYLSEVTLFEGVTSIGNSAFEDCRSLTSLTLPEGVTSIGGRAFDDCRSLISLTLPEGVTSIGNYAFEYCRSLTSIVLPPTVISIGSYAFNGCSILKEIRIPSSIRSVGDYAFSSCSSLNDVYVYTVEPISIGQNTFVKDGNNFVGTLHAPKVSYWDYYYDTQWSQFVGFAEFDEPYDNFYVEGDKVLDDTTGDIRGDEEGNDPDAEMGENSGIIVEDDIEQDLGDVDIEHDGEHGGSIIVGGGGHVHGDKFHFHINVKGGRWYFFCFPFDIKAEDIKLKNGAEWVFRYYDGEERACNGKGGWKNVASDGEGNFLKAATGYIFQCSADDVLILTAKDKKIKKENKYNELVAHVTENAHDASWNFVGNPYLSYYEVTADDYSAPITVWDGSQYIAIRPGDDDYQLAPFEAFFVQKPEGKDKVNYDAERQHTYHQSQEAAAQARARRRTQAINPERLLVNLTLTDGQATDKTRVVFNNSVSMEYEMECDAAKFSTAGVPQLYTIDSRAVKYAINERPVAEGIVTVGFTAPAQGNYTIAAPRMDTPMLLRDNATGTIHDFSEGSYEFASEAGTFDDRFTLMMKAGETSIDELESTGNGQQSTVIYDVAGRRVNEATEQGIYIKGNRKVVTL